MSDPLSKDVVDPNPPSLRSKKFIAFLVSEITTKLLLGMMVLLHSEALGVLATTVMIAFIVIGGFVAAGYILGVASLDKFTRVAEIAAQHGRNAEDLVPPKKRRKDDS